MDISVIVAVIVEAIAIIFGFGIAYRELKEIKKKASQEGLDGVKERVARLEANFDSHLKTLMSRPGSPLRLTEYAEKVLSQIEFDKNIFPFIKDSLLRDLEKYELRTPYDVQEKAQVVVKNRRNDPIYDEMKKAIYRTGNNLDEVLAAIWIPLRDYYFEKYPEIIK